MAATARYRADGSSHTYTGGARKGTHIGSSSDDKLEGKWRTWRCEVAGYEGNHFRSTNEEIGDQQVLNTFTEVRQGARRTQRNLALLLTLQNFNGAVHCIQIDCWTARSDSSFQFPGYPAMNGNWKICSDGAVQRRSTHVCICICRQLNF